MANNHCKRWTPEEEQRVMRQVRAFPQNLNKCFLLVSEEIGRTPTAVSTHWYTKLSKDPRNTCFFWASSDNVTKNRKNGLGIHSNVSIWRRLLTVLRSLGR